jgi:ribosome-binding protein aMBF1 (putative translation factor)
MKKTKRKPYVSAEPFFKEAMKNKEIKILYEQELAIIEIARAVRNARVHARLTQAGLAKKMGTSQSLVARLESGQDERTPTLPLLARIFAICGGQLELGVKFKPAN